MHAPHSVSLSATLRQPCSTTASPAEKPHISVVHPRRVWSLRNQQAWRSCVAGPCGALHPFQHCSICRNACRVRACSADSTKPTACSQIEIRNTKIASLCRCAAALALQGSAGCMTDVRWSVRAENAAAAWRRARSRCALGAFPRHKRAATGSSMLMLHLLALWLVRCLCASWQASRQRGGHGHAT